MERNSGQAILKREISRVLEQATRISPAVVLVGARQTGKTTLVRTLPELSNRPYLSLDDLEIRSLAEHDPSSLVTRAPALVLDEVQRVKDLLIAVKQEIDRDRTPGRFVLTGSANLLMMERVSETLAGRAIYVTLWPLARRERLGFGRSGLWSELLAAPFADWSSVLRGVSAAPEDWRAAARLGGLPIPSLTLEDEADRALWFTGYVQTYLERDLQVLRAVENLTDFRRLMRAAALRIGALLNQTELGRDVGMAQPQVGRFLNLMETSYQIIRLPTYSRNRTKRLIKSPKLYWSDTALALFLSGESEPRGAHLENLVLSDLLAWREAQIPRPELLYWRTATGLEVDFVVETASRLLPIEVKAASRVTHSDAKGLESFLDEYPEECDGALLLHTGEETFPVSRRVLATPWWRVC